MKKIGIKKIAVVAMLCFAAGTVHAKKNAADLERELSELGMDDLMGGTNANNEAIMKYMQEMMENDEIMKSAMEYSKKYMEQMAKSDTPLTIAARNGDAAEVERLIKSKKVDVNAADGTFDFTPLMHAAQHNRADIAKLLINAGAKVNQKNKNDVSALFVACSSNAPDVAKLLVAAGADMNYVQKGDGATPLSMACRDVCFETAKVLVEAGADVNKRIDSILRKNAKTALMEAASTGSPKVVKLLIDAGADVNARDINGFTPLILWGGRDDSLEVGKLLIAAKADVNAKNKYGETALMVVARSFSYAAMKLFIDSGADVNAKSNDGMTALMNASGIRGNPSPTGVKMLINAGADVNAKSNYGFTALHYAARDNAFSIARTLVAAGANVNAQNREGATPIMIAASSIDSGPEAVMEIIAGGANLGIRANNGWTALEYAREFRLGAIEEVIERALKKR
ncbi:MAG: ankyrin repeat domain-containing protein [Treponemataceae bacterium]|nr:ankyrin repeat domain-containing protein [Treponemataceae bacterium]